MINTIIHGDCLEVMKNIPDGSIDAIITDTPYGSTKCSWDSVIPFEPMWAELKRIIKPNGAIVLFGSEPFSSALRMSNIKQYKYDWIWEKNRGTGHLNAKIMPLSIYENIIVFGKSKIVYNPQKEKGEPYKRLNCLRDATNKGCYGTMNKTTDTINEGYRFPKNILKFPKVERTLHPTQKPVALIEYLIKTYTNEGETVLDFTSGSGTTGIAAQNTNRNYILIEKDEGYYNISKERLLKNKILLGSI